MPEGDLLEEGLLRSRYIELLAVFAANEADTDMVSQPATAVRWTTRDIEVLPQNEWTTYEIIDGELFVTRSPHRRHQRIIGKLHRALDEWSDQSGLGEPIFDAGLILSGC